MSRKGIAKLILSTAGAAALASCGGGDGLQRGLGMKTEKPPAQTVPVSPPKEPTSQTAPTTPPASNPPSGPPIVIADSVVCWDQSTAMDFASCPPQPQSPVWKVVPTRGAKYARTKHDCAAWATGTRIPAGSVFNVIPVGNVYQPDGMDENARVFYAVYHIDDTGTHFSYLFDDCLEGLELAAGAAVTWGVGYAATTKDSRIL